MTVIQHIYNHKILNHLLAFSIGIPLLLTGICHFVNIDFFTLIVPNYLPAPKFFAYISGWAQFFVALAILYPPTRNIGARALLLMLFAFLPSNIYLIVSKSTLLGASPFLWWMRLPLQFLLIVLAWIMANHPEGNG